MRLPILKVYCLGFIPTATYNTGSAVLRAVGDTKRPLYFLIVSCLTNIVLDLYFVLGLNLGVFGAAAATLISQVVSAVLVTVALLHAAGPIRLHPRKLRFQPKILGQIVKVGLPTGLQSDMYSISNLLIQSTINSFGTDTMAAWTAYGKVDGFFWMVLSAYGIAISTFAGQNFGAQKYDRIRKSVKVCLGMARGRQWPSAWCSASLPSRFWGCLPTTGGAGDRGEPGADDYAVLCGLCGVPRSSLVRFGAPAAL